MSRAPIAHNPESSPACHEATGIKLVPQRLHIQWIFAKQHFLKPKSQNVRARRVNHGLRHPGVCISFADSCNPFVRVYQDDYIVLC